MENGIPPGNPQHELMAAHYRDIIKDAIKEFEDSFDEEIYEALAWVGLMGSGLVNEETGLPPSPTVVWSQLDQALRITIYNTVKSFKDNNDACQ